MLQLGVVVFPFTQDVFDVMSHSMFEWAIIIALALAPVTIIELTKIIAQMLTRHFKKAGT